MIPNDLFDSDAEFIYALQEVCKMSDELFHKVGWRSLVKALTCVACTMMARQYRTGDVPPLDEIQAAMRSALIDIEKAFSNGDGN